MEARRRKGLRISSRNIQTEERDRAVRGGKGRGEDSRKKRKIKNLAAGRLPVFTRFPVGRTSEGNMLLSSSLSPEVTPLTAFPQKLFSNPVLAMATSHSDLPTTINVSESTVTTQTLLKPRTAMSLSRLTSGCKTFLFPETPMKPGPAPPQRTVSNGTFEVGTPHSNKRSWMSSINPLYPDYPKIDLALLLNTLKADSQSPAVQRKNSFTLLTPFEALTRPVTSDFQPQKAKRWNRPRASPHIIFSHTRIIRNRIQNNPKTANSQKKVPRLSEKPKTHLICNLSTPKRRTSHDSIGSWHASDQGLLDDDPFLTHL